MTYAGVTDSKPFGHIKPGAAMSRTHRMLNTPEGGSAFCDTNAVVCQIVGMHSKFKK